MSYCRACLGFGWIEVEDGFNQCEDCAEDQRARNRAIMSAGGSLGITINLDGSTSEWFRLGSIEEVSRHGARKPE